MIFVNNFNLYSEAISELKEDMIEIEEYVYANDLEDCMFDFEDDLFMEMNKLIADNSLVFETDKQYKLYVQMRYLREMG